MANIGTYSNDSTIDPADKLIGSDGTSGADAGKTKNYTVSSLSTHISANLSSPVKISGLSEAADDTAAASAGIAVNGLYRTGSVLKIRVS